MIQYTDLAIDVDLLVTLNYDSSALIGEQGLAVCFLVGLSFLMKLSTLGLM